LAKPKACKGRVSGRERVQRHRAAQRRMGNFKNDFNVHNNWKNVNFLFWFPSLINKQCASNRELRERIDFKAKD
jgi:hypothetical protein